MMWHRALTLALAAWLVGVCIGSAVTYYATRGEECRLIERGENPFDMVNRSGQGWYVRMIHEPSPTSGSIWQLCRHR